MTRGRLRIYLGAAPGVGKTFAMLGEGNRRAARGADVVIGYLETHGRPATEAEIGRLETLPRRRLEHRGVTLEEFDLPAALARHPQVVLVDELAHTNAPGAEHAKRWEDVEDLLAAGIDVISTVNVQHLESLNDVVESITGVAQQETVPDGFVRAAEQVELVDLTPEALRRRMVHGNIYPPDRIAAALENHFRIGNLSALRELALLWVADRVDEGLQRYMDAHEITATWETRERVVVAVTGAASSEALIRRAARMAQRAHGDLIGVHVRTADGLTRATSPDLAEHVQLLADLGGAHHEVVADDAADALVAFARTMKATQLVLGASHRSRWTELVHGSIINRAIRRSDGIDVHVISTGEAEPAPLLPPIPARRSPLSPRRRAVGWCVAVAGPVLATACLLPLRGSIDLSTVLLVHLLAVCAAAGIGGLGPAVCAALATAVLTNWFFTAPLHTLAIRDPEQIVALVIFLAVGGLVGLLVGHAARLSHDAERARGEAEALTAAVIGAPSDLDVLHAMLAHVRVAFGQDAAALIDRDGAVVAMDGPTVASATVTAAAGNGIEVTPDRSLVLVPGGLDGDDLRLLAVFTARLRDLVDRAALEEVARDAHVRRRADAFRTAILRAVSHDLRSPLASIKASSSSLLQHDVVWSLAARDEFAQTIDDEADRLDRLIANLLDMSRIEAGALRVAIRPSALEEIVAAALVSVRAEAGTVAVTVPPTLPDVAVDPGLLERAFANIIGNALRHRPEGSKVEITASVRDASAGDSSVVVAIADHGPGVAPADVERLDEPFQRLGDSGTDGVGLGLAVTRGFLDAMAGTLSFAETPGGGLTVAVSLPTTPAAPQRTEATP